MLDPNKTEVIIAGPGVGKTTELLNRIEKALGEGTNPLEIAFFSFSTTAVNEGLTRITNRLESYHKNQFRYFRTLHSMAFQLLGLDAKQVISFFQTREFAKQNNLKLANIDYRTGAIHNQTPDSIMLANIDSARMLGKTIREYYIENHLDNIERAEDIAAKYQSYKLTNGVVDFTDMILLVNKTEVDTPHFKYMFIDEAQDLSTQQWMFVEKLAKNTDNVIIVGDERQAIAEFAGADVDYFLKIRGEVSTLSQSYRVPENIFKLARKVERHMIKTRHAIWKPREPEWNEPIAGEVIRTSTFPLKEITHGNWLLLTRTNAQLQEVSDFMMKMCASIPMFFTINGAAPVDQDVFKAIMAFNAIHINPKITKYDFITIDPDDTPEKKKTREQFILMFKKFMSSSKPKSTEVDPIFRHRFDYRNWYDAFDKLTMTQKNYIKAVEKAYRENQNAYSNPAIKLSTIHSSKGMEADNVILYTDLSKKIYTEWKQFEESNDTEYKVLFVAITRARKKLYLFGTPNTKYSYMEVL